MFVFLLKTMLFIGFYWVYARFNVFFFSSACLEVDLFQKTWLSERFPRMSSESHQVLSKAVFFCVFWFAT